MYYILAGADVVVPVDVTTWARWFEVFDHRRVAVDQSADGAVHVSTVFMGLDHNFGADGPPILWETLVFGGPLDGQGARYASHQAALDGHRDWCARALA